MMEAFVAFAVGFGVLQASTYLYYERRFRHAWSTGAAAPRAPLHVRATALWSIGMGQMLVPGALLAAGGVLIYGIGLVGIPGCILAARIWALGPALLRADPSAITRARAAARLAWALNAVVLLVAAGLCLEPDLLGLAAFIGLYAGISIAHGFALERAADAVEDLWRVWGHATGRTPSAWATHQCSRQLRQVDAPGPSAGGRPHPPYVPPQI